MTRKRVLIADDFTDTRRLMKLLIENEAVKKAVKDRPNLILMDIAMPIMDGIQATQAIRRHYDSSEVPIVAVTAYGDFYKDRAKDAGCNDVVQKPLAIADVSPLVEKFMH